MSIYYFDSSGLVKYYLIEPGTTWVRQIVDASDKSGRPLNIIYTTDITKVEIPAAIAIIYRSGRIGKRLRTRLFLQFMQGTISRYQFLATNDQMLTRAAYLTQHHSLKAYDAIHLASALVLKRPLDKKGLSLTFVSGDKQLLRAAIAEGLSTENPFDHTDLDP